MVRVQLVGFSSANSPFRKPSFLRWDLGTSEFRDPRPLSQAFPSSSCPRSVVPTTAQDTPRDFTISSKYEQGRSILIQCWPRTHPFFSSILYAMQGYIKGQPLRANSFYPRNKFFTTLQQLEIQLSKGPGSHHPQVGIVIPLYQMFVLPKIVLQLFQVLPPYLYQMFLVESCFSKDLSRGQDSSDSIRLTCAFTYTKCLGKDPPWKCRPFSVTSILKVFPQEWPPKITPSPAEEDRWVCGPAQGFQASEGNIGRSLKNLKALEPRPFVEPKTFQHKSPP